MVATLMERGLRMAARAIPESAGGDVLYQRDTQRVTCRAAFGRSQFAVESADATLITFSDRDFLIAVDDLILGGQKATPTRGDKITLIDPSGRFGDVFEVSAPRGADVYSTDQNNSRHRIHAKKIG